MRFFLTMFAALFGLAAPALAQAIPGGNGPHIATRSCPKA